MLEFFLRLLSLISVFSIVIVLGLFIAKPKLKDKAFENISYKKDLAIGMGKALAQKGRNNFHELHLTAPNGIVGEGFKKPREFKKKERKEWDEKVKKMDDGPAVTNASPARRLVKLDEPDYPTSNGEPFGISENFIIPRKTKNFKAPKGEPINVTPKLERAKDNLHTPLDLEDIRRPERENVPRLTNKITGNLLNKIPSEGEHPSKHEKLLSKPVGTFISKKKIETLKRNERLLSIFEKLEIASRRLEGR